MNVRQQGNGSEVVAFSEDRYEQLQGLTVPAILRQRAQTDPERPFVHVRGHGSETFAETYGNALRAAAVLDQEGLGKGSNLLVMLPTSLSFLHVWFGANLLGAVDVNLNSNYRGGPLAHAINISGATTMVVEYSLLQRLLEVEGTLTTLTKVLVIGSEGQSLPRSRHLSLKAFQLDNNSAHSALAHVEPQYCDIASVLFTSGTTGPAKGVMMPHAQAVLVAHQVAQHLRITEDDVFYCVHPLYHMAGKFEAVLASLLVGCSIVLDTEFEPEHWLERVREHGATVSIGHGPMLEMIHAQPRRPTDSDNPLRALLCAPLPPAIAEDFEQRFGVRGIETWGMTEVTCVTWRPYDAPLKLGSSGRPSEDLFELQISDPTTGSRLPPGAVGEVTVRPRLPWTTMQGYLGMPDSTIAAWRNLWFHTGDSGYVDDEGDLFFVDRDGDRIRRRAENIASYDIEVAACLSEGVKEAAAIGVPSGYHGDDDVKLCAVLDGSADMTPEVLLRELAGRLPHYMVPRYIEFLESLPRTPTNKVQKHLLRESGINESTWDRKAAGISLREVADSASGADGKGSAPLVSPPLG